MPRPPKKRLIENIPEIKYFKPAGVPRREIEEIRLTLEEVEALRLKDKKGMNQQECAEKMGISRPTFQRILVSAHEKIAEALLEGKGIRFKGGDYRIARGNYQCVKCETVFKHRNRRRNRRGQNCPECGGEAISKKEN